MKPKRIILVRHGQSEGNADRNLYAQKPDYKLDLTNKGREQALLAGKQLKELLGKESVKFYISPYWRTRQTYAGILKAFEDNDTSVVEDPRLREQDWGHIRAVKTTRAISQERLDFGTFYFRIPSGESGADVFDRISTFLETLYRDFQKQNLEQNVVIVAHGLLMRLFLMRWYHWSVEKFELLKNPVNCEIAIMELQENERYKLITPLRKR